MTLYRTTDHWWLDQTVKKLIAFRSRKFFAYHSKPSVLSVTWCAKKKEKKSYVGPHDFRSYILYDLFYWLNSLSERDTSLLLRETIMCLISIWYSLSLYFVSGLERRSLITSFQTRYNNLFSYYNLILRKLWEKLPEKRAKILSEDIGSCLCPPGHPIILL